MFRKKQLCTLIAIMHRPTCDVMGAVSIFFTVYALSLQYSLPLQMINWVWSVSISLMDILVWQRLHSNRESLTAHLQCYLTSLSTNSTTPHPPSPRRVRGHRGEPTIQQQGLSWLWKDPSRCYSLDVPCRLHPFRASNHAESKVFVFTGCVTHTRCIP